MKKKLIAMAVSAVISISAMAQTGVSLVEKDNTVSAAESSYNYG